MIFKRDLRVFLNKEKLNCLKNPIQKSKIVFLENFEIKFTTGN